MVNFDQFEVNRVARGQKRNETPDSKPVGRWQNDRRRILDTLGQAALLRVRPGAFLFVLARLYTRAFCITPRKGSIQNGVFGTTGRKVRLSSWFFQPVPRNRMASAFSCCVRGGRLKAWPVEHGFLSQ